MTTDKSPTENGTPERDGDQNTTGSADGDVTADTASGGAPEE
jgi:hypothetical protein